MKSPVLMAALLAASVAACGRSPRPATSPAPAPHPATASGDRPTAARADGARPGSVAEPDTVDVSRTEVTRSAVGIFGDSVAEVPAPDSSAEDAAVAEPTWDIDVRSYETQASVEKYVGIFTGRARDTFTAWLERGTRYDAMIRQKFRAGGLPEDMVYLALVESGYNPHAYSRAAAVGMWQFMASTARGTGLRVDWWVDERRDPVRSTDAALKFIGWLREQFGSLYLAAAAYNGGPGRVSRGLTRYAGDLEGMSGEDVFFALAEKDYLRAETKNYVPQLIAAALIAKEPARYGLKIERQPAYVYDSVRVGPAVPLAAVATAVGARPLDIVDLNPHILRGMTPPSGTIWVRVPVGRAGGFDSTLAALPATQRVAYTRVVSKKNETLAAIADRSGRSARQLAWYNPKLEKTKRGRLAAGQTVIVPTAAVVAAAQDVPDPSVERYGTPRGSAVRVHVVKRGETINGIARRYKTTPARLRALNSIRGSLLYPGQQLVVKGTPSKARRSSARSSAKRSAAARGSSAKPVRKSSAKGARKGGTTKHRRG
ncbi:MAG: transglycosylase SLT domain-containing protein [Gemmatimonadaceae bacterium]